MRAHETQPAPKHGKPGKSLHFLSADERKEYDNLRRYGCTRDEALIAILAEPKCS